MEDLPSPSQCASDPRRLFEHSGTLAGRPFGRGGLPTALFDGHLAGLVDDLDDLKTAVPEPSPAMVSWALQYLQVAVGFDSKEAVMEAKLRPLLDHILPDAQWQQSIQGGKPEAHARGGIFELKNESGIGGDPQAQSIADYEKLIADPTTMWGKLKNKSCLPTVLITQAGPLLDVSVAVCAGEVLVDHLFNISLRYKPFGLADQVKTVARLATCLKKTLDGLSRYYTNLLETTAAADMTTSDAIITTSALHLPAPVGKPVDPTDPTDREANMHHAVFVALGRGVTQKIPKDEVVIKFTESYNADAHRALAELGLAPKLHFHGHVRGGLQMIVMEKVVGCTAFAHVSKHGALPRRVYHDISRAITTLHSLDLVFGDLRLPNIMIREQEANGRVALLVDFDWAAVEREGLYPATIAKTGEWALGVAPNGPMLQEHDLYCLERLDQKCNL
ncbi:hypothetical protein B0H16DRAFT_1306652 [Mycena metata]|uniref:Protein kinase domain-containing protein n=1 Tax=Mycena metata TaxID=1033252 RepID=A0AAD7JS17_9AGAR|nr:hypothetical protein B0H16DRAFT_1306652 [Mycena metata]